MGTPIAWILAIAVVNVIVLVAATTVRIFNVSYELELLASRATFIPLVKPVVSWTVTARVTPADPALVVVDDGSGAQRVMTCEVPLSTTVLLPALLVSTEPLTSEFCANGML